MAETLMNSDQGQDISQAKQDTQIQKKKILRGVGIALAIVAIILGFIVFQMQKENANQLASALDMSFESNNQQSSNYRTYVTLYQTTKAQLEETTKKLEEVNRQLDMVTAELDSTKALLAQTQMMLSQAQTENSDLKVEIQDIDSIQQQENMGNVKELQMKISNLKDQNVQVSQELDTLKSQLKAYEADFGDLQEGRSMITLFQNKIKLVKTRMQYLKQEAYFAKVKAQREKDRIASLNGNGGYVTRHASAHNQGQEQTRPFSINVNMLQ